MNNHSPGDIEQPPVQIPTPPGAFISYKLQIRRATAQGGHDLIGLLWVPAQQFFQQVLSCSTQLGAIVQLKSHKAEIVKSDNPRKALHYLIHEAVIR